MTSDKYKDSDTDIRLVKSRCRIELADTYSVNNAAIGRDASL